MTVLYPNPDEGDTLLGHTLIDDPGHTLPKMMAHIPNRTPSSCDDDAFFPDLAEKSLQLLFQFIQKEHYQQQKYWQTYLKAVVGKVALMKVIKVFNCS